MTFFYDLNKKLAGISEQPKQLNERANSKAVAEDFGATAAIAGGAALGSALGAVKGRYDDMKFRERGRTFGSNDADWDKPRTTMQRARAAVGFPSKNDPNVKPTEEGLGDVAKKVGGAVKSAAKKGLETLGHGSDADMMRDLQRKMGVPQTGQKPQQTKEEYGPMEGGEPMTPKQKKFAKLAPPKDKVTFADKIAGAKKEVDEMLGDVAAEAMRGALKGGQKKLDKNNNGKLDANDFAMLRKGAKAKQETDEGSTGDYSAKKARAGKDIGKPGKAFGKIAKGAAERYGSKAAGERVAGAVLNKLRHPGELEENAAAGYDPETQARIKAANPQQLAQMAQEFAGGPAQYQSELKMLQQAKAELSGQMEEGWDEMERDAKSRVSQMKTGDKKQGHKGEIEKTATGVKHTRRYDAKTGETDSDDAPTGEKRGRGRPKKTDKAPERVTAKATKHKGGRKTKEVDEEAVSQDQAVAARIARGVQKGEVKAKKGSASAEMAKMAPKELKKFAKTDTKGLPKKIKKEKTEEAGGVETPTASSGFSFGKGIYDSMNRELEKMIAESMSINMSDSTEGGKSLTVTASDEDALALADVLKNAGIGGQGGMEHSEETCDTCGSADCGCGDVHEALDENQPDWPTDEVTSDDALQYAGGLNKPKTTVAGDGQTTVPVTAVQVKEQEQVMAPEEVEESLARFRSLAGIKEAKKAPEDFDKDGKVETGPEEHAGAVDKAIKKAQAEKKVEESIFALTNQWKAYKG